LVEVTACISPDPDEYRLYPELPVLVKQKFDSREWTSSSLKKKKIYFLTHCMWSTTCNGRFHPSINQTFLSFLWVWNM